MSQYVPLRQHGKVWAEIDTRNGLLRIKRQRLTAVFDLRLLMAEDVQALIPREGEELPDISKDEALETVKRVAAANPFNQQVQHE